jgi:hypothetical protein
MTPGLRTVNAAIKRAKAQIETAETTLSDAAKARYKHMIYAEPEWHNSITESAAKAALSLEIDETIKEWFREAMYPVSAESALYITTYTELLIARLESRRNYLLQSAEGDRCGKATEDFPGLAADGKTADDGATTCSGEPVPEPQYSGTPAEDTSRTTDSNRQAPAVNGLADYEHEEKPDVPS